MKLKVLDPFRCERSYDEIVFHSEDDVTDVTVLSFMRWVELGRPSTVKVDLKGKVTAA